MACSTNAAIDGAYAAVVEFTRLRRERTRSAGFMQNLLLQRICSSFAAGLSTALKLLGRDGEEDEDDEELQSASDLTDAERAALEEVVDHLEAQPIDPKLEAVLRFLTGQPRWLELRLHHFQPVLRHRPVGRREAGREASRGADRPLRRSRPKPACSATTDTSTSSARHQEGGQGREIRLVVATDAACEGLNLQTLGTLINVDLPWNPSRLEQRIGRIKRFGQARDSVDMLNLVYHGTRDEQVYERLSQRMRDRYDIFGSPARRDRRRLDREHRALR